MQKLLARFEEMAAFAVFSRGRVRSVTLPGWSSAAPEAGPEHLGHPYSVLPTCTHTHYRIKVGGGQMTGVQGSAWD